jgi:hypothetical protein
VEAAHGIEDEAARVELFSSLLLCLEPDQAEDTKRRALDAVGAVPAVDQARENSPRAQVLMALAPNLLGPQREEIMAQALQAVQQLKRGYGDNPRLEALAAVAPLLSHEQRWPVLKRELDVVYDAEEPILRAKADALLFPYLNQDRHSIEKRDYALDTALHGSSPYNAQMLVNLIPHLTEAQRAQVMDELPLWSSADDRATILAALARHWPEADRSFVLERALKAIQEAESAAVKVVGLKTLASRLEGELLESAWQTSSTILDRASRASAMAVLAPCWAAAERAKKLDEALALLQTLVDDESRAQVLGQLTKNQATWVRARGALLQPLLIDLVRGAASGKRHMFLHRLLDLEPVWLTLTPPGTAWQVIQTVVEVSGQWQWP